MTRNLSTEFEIKSPANQFFFAYIKRMDLPEDEFTLEMKTKPLEKKITKLIMEGFLISEWYKAHKENFTHVATRQKPDLYQKLEGTMIVTHVEGNERDRATWTIEYEKNSSDVEDPSDIMDTFVEIFKEMDEHLDSTD